MKLNKKGQSREEQLAGTIMGAILLGLLLIGALIIAARNMFPYVLVLSGIILVVTLLAVVRDIFFREDYEDLWFIWPGIILIALLIASGILFIMGYGLSETSLGQAGLSVYSVLGIVSDAQDQVTKTLNDAISQVVEDSCKTLPSESCDLLRTTAKSAQTLQEVKDYASSLRNAAEMAEKISK